jgi:hypothetical protein
MVCHTRASHKPVVPNPVCADMVLLWMLQGVIQWDTDRIVVYNADKVLELVKHRVAMPFLNLGSGDVYSHTFDYTPLGIIGSAAHHTGIGIAKALNMVTPKSQLGTALRESSGVRTVV